MYAKPTKVVNPVGGYNPLENIFESVVFNKITALQFANARKTEFDSQKVVKNLPAL